MDKMKDLLIQAIETVVKRYPAVLPHLSADVLEVLKGGPGSGFHGHAGRPGEVGGSAPVGTMRISDIGDKNIEEKINKLCKKFGFPPEKVYASKTITTVLGTYNTVDDFIILSPFALGDNLEPVLAHELTHAKFQNIDEAQWREPLKDWTKEYLDVARADMDFDEVSRYEDDYRILVKEFGGVSDYSNKFWSDPDVIKTNVSFRIAVNETFAEIARLDVIGEGDKVPPNWRNVYERTFDK